MSSSACNERCGKRLTMHDIVRLAGSFFLPFTKLCEPSAYYMAQFDGVRFVHALRDPMGFCARCCAFLSLSSPEPIKYLF